MVLETDSKFEKKTDLWFKKWYDEFGKFSQSTQKIQNWDFYRAFYSKYKMYELKTHREVIWYDNEEWCKIWKRIELSVQNWHTDLINVNPSTNKSKKCAL